MDLYRSRSRMRHLRLARNSDKAAGGMQRLSQWAASGRPKAATCRRSPIGRHAMLAARPGSLSIAESRKLPHQRPAHWMSRWPRKPAHGSRCLSRPPSRKGSPRLKRSRRRRRRHRLRLSLSRLKTTTRQGSSVAQAAGPQGRDCPRGPRRGPRRARRGRHPADRSRTVEKLLPASTDVFEPRLVARPHPANGRWPTSRSRCRCSASSTSCRCFERTSRSPSICRSTSTRSGQQLPSAGRLVLEVSDPDSLTGQGAGLQRPQRTPARWPSGSSPARRSTRSCSSVARLRASRDWRSRSICWAKRSSASRRRTPTSSSTST